MSRVLDPSPEVAREALCEALRVRGLTAYNGVPEFFEPPCVVVQPADPHLTPGQFLRQTRIHHHLHLIAAPGDNTVEARQVDTLAVETVAALTAAGYHPGDVGGYFSLGDGGGTYLAATIPVAVTARQVREQTDPVTPYTTPEV